MRLVLCAVSCDCGLGLLEWLIFVVFSHGHLVGRRQFMFGAISQAELRTETTSSAFLAENTWAVLPDVTPAALRALQVVLAYMAVLTLVLIFVLWGC